MKDDDAAAITAGGLSGPLFGPRDWPAVSEAVEPVQLGRTKKMEHPARRFRST